MNEGKAWRAPEEEGGAGLFFVYLFIELVVDR